MTRNFSPGEGGPGGGQLESKIGAYYMLAMLCETEPRGLPGGLARKIKFQRGFEGHALDDIVVEGGDATGTDIALEIQAKRTLDFTASDQAYGQVIRQLVGAGPVASSSLAIAIARTSAKIERHYHQLLLTARKTSSGAAFRTMLDADRVITRGMRDFVAATQAQVRVVGGDDGDEALWRLLRRLQILVFDFESPGAVSHSLALTLAALALPPSDRGRATELWDALVAKALSYDADGGEITRPELIEWLRLEHSLDIVPSRGMAVARERLADHSKAALALIDGEIAGISLDRSQRVEAILASLETARFVEIRGASGTGKSALLKAVVDDRRVEARPFVLTPAGTPGGGWLVFSTQLGFSGSARDFLGELAASGCDILAIDGLDRFDDDAARRSIAELILAVTQVPAMRIVTTVGTDFTSELRQWLPESSIALLGRASHAIDTLSEEEARSLASADSRLAQLLHDSAAAPLTRNLFQLRQLAGQTVGALPLTEAGLARSWWLSGSRLTRMHQRDRLRALRGLARQAIEGQARLDIAEVATAVVEDLVRTDELVETIPGATAVYRHDQLRDWSVANLLIEDATNIEALPLASIAPVGLARSMDLYARHLLEQCADIAAWSALLSRLGQTGVHGSWRRAVLLALSRSEQAMLILDKAFGELTANDGELLADLIRLTGASDAESAVGRLVAAGVDPAIIPDDFRQPATLSWARLLVWLLVRLDQIDAPVGRDILHFFKQWLTAYIGRGDLAPAIVTRIHQWLTELENWSEDEEASQASRLFAYDGRYGRTFGLTQDIRTQFLLFCAAAPVLVEPYIQAHTGDRQYDDVVDDILNISTPAGQIAPAALADFTIDALITSEQQDAAAHGPSWTGRLTQSRRALRPVSPGNGPFLSILRGSSTEGLRLTRRLLEYGLWLDQPSAESQRLIAIHLPDGPRHFSAPGSYFLSRSVGAGAVMTIALRALEAWGHEQVDGGRPVMDVVDEILGKTGGPAALLAVAVDILLSHAKPADPSLIPFVSSPELLRLDSERFAHDRAGLSDVEGEDAFKVPGIVPTYLSRRGSRQTCLLWAASEFLVRRDETNVDEIRSRLVEERSRLEKGTVEQSITTDDPRWHADQALRRLDRANWRSVSIELGDGRVVPGWDYEPPAEEREIAEPRAVESDMASRNLMLTIQLVSALLDPDKRTDALLGAGLAWARSIPLDGLSEDPEDFELAQRWRAVVATASLVMLSRDHDVDRPWAKSVLERAIIPCEASRFDRATAQIRYHAAALASLGWVPLAAEGNEDAQSALMTLATRQDRALISAIGGAFSELALSDDRLPRALLRLGLHAAIFPARVWDDPDVEARRKAEREDRLVSAVAAEKLWLDGGDEPAWPVLPPSRHLRRNARTISLPCTKAESDWEDFEEELDARPKLDDPSWFNHQTGGAWLTALGRNSAVCRVQWVSEFVTFYRPWSLDAWGAGLPNNADLSLFPTEWLDPFEQLFLRSCADLPAGRFEETVIAPLIALPNDSVLAAGAIIVPAADSFFWDEKILPIDRLVSLRAAVGLRIRQTPSWRWRKDEQDQSMSTTLAGTVRGMFFHPASAFGTARCYLPTTAASFGPTLPALAALSIDAPGRAFIADLFLAVCERASDWMPLPLALDVFEAWLSVRGAQASFWRDDGFGRRICAMLAKRCQTGDLPDATVLARVRILIDALISAGVVEGVALEAQLEVA